MMQEEIQDLDVNKFHKETAQKLEKWKIVAKLIPPNGLVLDVGCYNGTFGRYLRMNANMLGIRYVGVNVCNEALKDAKGRSMDAVLASYDFLPFKNESFDTCSLLHIIEHIYFPEKAVIEVYRILKPNGKLILVARNFANFIDRVHMLMGQDFIPGLEKSELIRFFTWRSLNGLLRRHGLKLEERQTWFLPFPARRVTEKYTKWRKAMRLSARLFPNLDESLIGRWTKTSEQ